MIALLLSSVLATQAVAAAPAIGPAVSLDDKVGTALPRDARFTDSSGTPVAIGDYLGKRPVVLILAYARCRMLCSVVLRASAAAMHSARHVAGRDFTPIVVSIDPRETPDEAARDQTTLLEQLGTRDRAAWPYLVGDDAQIHAVADAVGFHYAWDDRTEQYAHPAAIFVIAPDGRLAETLRGVTFDQLDDALDRAARGELTPATASDLVRCFHDDPARRLFEARLQFAFRAGGALLFVGLVSLVFGLARWERRRARRSRP
jgi:protein SCO1/2|nr:SCO family protein [Kofleriaceae bacterium]